MTKQTTTMRHTVNVDSEHEQTMPAGVRSLLEKTIITALVAEQCSPCEVSVLITDDEGSRRLNREYRGMDEPTDVLSFPQDDDGVPWPDDTPRLLGDIVINYERVAAQAYEYGHAVEREWAFLAVHGVLHLLGYDHQHEDDTAAMRAREEALLQHLGLSVKPHQPGSGPDQRSNPHDEHEGG